MLEQEKRQTHEEELGQLFHVFDADNKGYISAERLQRTLAEMGEQGGGVVAWPCISVIHLLQ